MYCRRPDGSASEWVRDFESLTVVDRFNAVGRWTVTTRDPATAALLGEHLDGGVVVRRGVATVMSGPIDHVDRDHGDSGDVWTFSGPDDFVALADTLTWPQPASPVGQQTDSHAVHSGPAETVILNFVRPNLLRVGSPVAVPPSQGRGAQVTARGRFTNLLELVAPLATASGLRLHVAQGEDRVLRLRVDPCRDLRGGLGLFSDRVGTVLSWQFTQDWPAATRVVVGAGGEGAARLFRLVSDESAETSWGRTVEVFRDRRDLPADAAGTPAEMDATGRAAISEAGPAVAVRVSVPDAAGLVYGVDVTVGDLVRVYPGDVAVDDRITEATLTVDGRGERTSMWVGRKDPDPDERAEQRARDLDRRIRQLERAY